MQIIIDENTLTEDIVYLLNTDNVSAVLKEVDPLPLDTDITEMTIEEFDNIISNQALFLSRLARENKKALAFLGKYRCYKDSIEGFFKFVRQFEVKQSNEEKQAATGINWPSFSDRMLSSLIKYYGLHSIGEASKMKVKEYLFCVQDEGSTALFNSRLNEIYSKKNKKK